MMVCADAGISEGGEAEAEAETPVAHVSRRRRG